MKYEDNEEGIELCCTGWVRKREREMRKKNEGIN